MTHTNRKQVRGARIKQARFLMLVASSLSLLLWASLPLANRVREFAADENAPTEPLDAREAKARALIFLGRTDLNLTQQGFPSWDVTQGKGLKCYHFGGPENEFLSVDVDATSGEVRNYTWGRLLIESKKVNLTLEQAEQQARTFLAKRTGYSSMPGILLVERKLLDHGDAGKEYSFEWGRIVKGVEYPFGLTVSVSAQTGEPTNYIVVERPLPSNLTPAITRERALSIAVAKCDLEPGYTSQATLTIWNDLQWRITFKGRKVEPYNPQEGQVAYDAQTDVIVNGTSGEIKEAHTFHAQPRHIVQLRQPNHPYTYLSDDNWPAWTAQPSRPMLFITSRGRDLKATDEDFAEGKPGSYADVLAVPFGEQIINLFAAPGAVEHIACAASGQRVAFEMYGVLYVLDLASSRIGQCNDRERAQRRMPAWDASGKLLVTSGTHSPTDDVGTEDEDIWVSEIKDTLGMVASKSNKCIAHLPGRDILPNWTPDSKTIVFAHQGPSDKSQPTKRQNWSLLRVRSDLSRLAKEYEPPQKLTALAAEPERLSVFPDGKRVLISYLDNEYSLRYAPQVLDIATKSLRPLQWPALHDPNLPKGQPLIPRELTVSPDGERIAFRALGWSGDAKDVGAICIYSCKLDGSGLKRVTSPTAAPLQIHQYPQPGITALNAWEKLQPKHNEGVPMSPAR